MGSARRYVELEEPLWLRHGAELRQARVAYESWGALSPARDNVLLLLTGLSPSAHARSSPEDPAPGWWEDMIGPGLAIDTRRFHVVCVNSLGSCFGSTGPASVNPRTGRPYGPTFPDVTLRDGETILDTLNERNQELKADAFIATDPDGVVVARTDKPTVQGEDLSKDPLVEKPMSGEESATVWRQGERLFHAVSVPMVTGASLKGVLIASYGINEALAGDIRKITHSEIAYLTQEPGKPPQLSISTLGARESALKAALARPEFAQAGGETFELDLGGESYIGIVVPLMAATGQKVGAVAALRSLDVEMASFREFRNSLVLVSLVVMALGLLMAYLAAARITGPVRTLVTLVEKARDGSYSGAVSVATSDEIGTLARAFNSLLADLREKEQLIGFLSRQYGIPSITLSQLDVAPLLGRGPLVLGAAVVFFVAILAFCYSRHAWLSAALLAVAGAAMVNSVATVNSLIQTLVPDHIRGRISTLDRGAELTVFGLSSYIAGGMMYYITPQTLTVISGLLSALAGIVWFVREKKPDTIAATPPR